MKTLFTDRSIADIELPAGRNDMWAWDSETAGLGLRLRRGSTDIVSRTWYLSYSIGGSDKRDPLGKFSDLTLADARALVHQRRRDLIEDGTDPRAVVAEREAATASRRTLGEAAEAYLAHGKWRRSTERAHERYLRGPYFKPLLGRCIRDISREQIAARLNEIARSSRHAAKQARTSLREVYRFALAEGWVESTLVVDGTRDPSPKKDFVPRDRVLSDAELIAVWNAGDALIRLLILTGCRREEIGGMLWSEIDGNVFALPAERSKTNTARDIPLSPAAVAILLSIPRVEGRERVFPTNSWSYIKGRLPALDTPWRLHDLRRTMRTGLSEIGILPHVAELCIGHKREKIVGTYDLARQWQEQAAAFARWAEHVAALVNGAPSNVVSIHAA